MTVKQKPINEKEKYSEAKKGLLKHLYRRLNPEQQKAVFQIKGPLLVLAGAGSGKTTVLTKRIEYIISFGDLYHSEYVPGTEAELNDRLKMFGKLKESGSDEEIREYLHSIAEMPAFPWRVLCITFTNKAANEFKSRLSYLLGEGAKDIWAGTFHSVCVRILRAHSGLLGFSNGFTIYDADDSKRVISAIIKRLDIDEKIISSKGIRNEISRIKEKGLLPDDYEEEATTEREETVLRVYRAYQAELKAASALDFDDIILYTTLLFEKNPEILNKYRDQFDYILVDEYQDTNPSQSKLVYMLAGTKKNVCVVGDDDQSIYSFRGATIDNILNFDKVYPEAVTVRLEQNYRSTKTILSAANAIIANNNGRKGKNLWTSGDEGERIILKKQLTQSEESGYIVNYIKEKVSAGASYSDFAVLYRQNAQSNALEIIFSKSHIPYSVYGGIRFYDHKEIKDLLAYLSVIDNPDDNLRLKRIINVPKRAIGATTVQYLSDISEKSGKSMYEVMRISDQFEELQKSSSKLNGFCDFIDEMRALSREIKVSSLIQEVITRTKYKEMLVEAAVDK
ncbi:MAG: UvrD-helicase domain-containing protein [Clostridia bacterium]|nr:UvrD-helicase domain-containing protein [Clostridia bacterium]